MTAATQPEHHTVALRSTRDHLAVVQFESFPTLYRTCNVGLTVLLCCVLPHAPACFCPVLQRGSVRFFSFKQDVILGGKYQDLCSDQHVSGLNNRPSFSAKYDRHCSLLSKTTKSFEIDVTEIEHPQSKSKFPLPKRFKRS